MRTFALRNARSGETLATHVARASHPWTRLAGLLPRARVAASEGLWIGGCSAVHTMCMRATIDIYFLDHADRVLKIEESIAPNRLAVTCRGASTVVELGTAVERRDVNLGDLLILEPAARPITYDAHDDRYARSVRPVS